MLSFIRRPRQLMIGLAAALSLAGLVFGSVHLARAFGVPTTGTLSYTGSLLTFGQPDDGTHQISVALWLGGASSAACTTTALGVQTVNGQFTVPLSPACVQVIHQNQNVQVEVSIDSQALGTTPLAAVPYAVEAGSVSATSVLTNIGLMAAVASNALTITLTQGDGASAPSPGTPTILAFGTSAPTSAALSLVQVTATASITVPPSATLGQASGVSSYTYVYALDANGAVDLCVSSNAALDEGTPQAATVIGAGSTSPTALYCGVTALGPVRLVGRVQATEATAGTWATSPTSVAIPPFNAPGFKPPTVTRELSSSGTYTTPTSPAPLYLRVRMVGGGGGASGAGLLSSPGATGGAGGLTTFGTSLLVAGGGSGGVNGAGGDPNGVGGTVSVGAGATALVAEQGSYGSGGTYENTGYVNQAGGSGGASPFGGAGGGAPCGNGISALANSGSGGGGAGTGAISQSQSGSGGGAGGYIEAIINNPAASYTYAIGTGGGGGATTTGGGCAPSAEVGGNGGSGLIIVEEHYQ